MNQDSGCLLSYYVGTSVTPSVTTSYVACPSHKSSITLRYNNMHITSCWKYEPWREVIIVFRYSRLSLMRITTIPGLLICCEAYLDLTFTPETGQYSQFINRIEFQNDGKVNFFRQVDSDSPATVYTCAYVDKDVGDGIAINVQGVLCSRMIKDSNGLLDGKFLTMKATYDKTYLVARLPKGAIFYVYVWPRTCYLSTDGRFVDYIYSIIVTERRAQFVRQKDEISPKILYTCDSTTTIASGGLEVKLGGIQCRKMIQESEGQLDDNFLTFDIDFGKGVLTTKLPEGKGIAKYTDSGCPL